MDRAGWRSDSTPSGNSAKSAYKLTEAEILTLRHEEIQASPKTFFPLQDVIDLAERKFLFGAGDIMPLQVDKLQLRVWKKTSTANNRRTRGNWDDNAGHMVFVMELAQKLKAVNAAKKSSS
ncbi:hypothetical protein HGRIS_005246 [Hohenbuehelia grisea]|uniref:Uncharacterized protein n=1 Tax=Hohenbuehelia grisea TaxID=104357 RepID=A0ABR3JEN2_9AGAR